MKHPQIIHACKVCNKCFIDYASNNRIFCSKKCAYIGMKKRKHLTEIHKRRIARAHINRVLQGIISPLKGRKRPASVGKKVSLAKKGIPHLNQRGKNNGQWKGNNAGYIAFHSRVTRARGKPQKCDICKTTTKRKYEWANLTGQYTNIYDYKRMCTSCHRKYDLHRKNFT